MNSKGLFVAIMVWGVHALGADVLNLSRAYERALQNEPRLKSASYKMEANAEAIEQVSSKFYPQLQGSVSWGRYEYDAHYLPGAVKENYTDYSISLVQPIFHPEYWREHDQVKNRQTSGEYKYQVQAQQLGLDVTKSYFLLLKEMNMVALAQAQKYYYEQKYKQLEEMLKFGLTNRIDLLEAKVQRDKSISSWLIEQKRAQVAKLKLEHLVGEKIDVVKSFDFGRIDTSKLKLERSVFEAKITNNLSLKAAQSEVRAAFDEVAMREYDHYPKIDLSLTRKETNSGESVSHNYDNQAVVRMSVPLYQGGYTQSRVRESLKLLSSAQQEEKYYSKDAQGRFEEIWEERQYTIEHFEALKESLVSAELYVKSVEKGHEAGLKSVVDFLEAQEKLYQIKYDLVDAGFELVNNHLSLLDVIGELDVKAIEQYEAFLY